LKKTVNIDFCDFRPNFSKTDNFFYHLLSERYEVRLCDQPDFLLFGPYGHSHRLHSGVRVLISVEPFPPDYRFCDYSISCLKVDDPRHLHLPVYVSYCNHPERALKAADDPEQILRAKTKFCSFIVSNYRPRKNANRVDFFHALSRYKRVDSAGRALDHQRLLQFFDRIFTTPIEPVGRRSLKKWSFLGRWIPVKRHHWHPQSVRSPSALIDK
jgi:hypothetical protein